MKDLHEGHLYWQTTLPDPNTYPPLEGSIEADAVIIGGGMSGSITGYVLARSGLRTVLLERDLVAGGSSMANTGLLQFCNDIMLKDLIEQIGEADAVTFYRACAKAVNDLSEIAHSLPADTEFYPRSSLYCASSDQDVPGLKREYEALKASGFDVEYWEPDRIGAHFPFRKPGAIVTHGDAEVNPFRFVHTLIDEGSQSFGLRVHEHTDIVSHRTDEAGKHVLKTSSGATVHANHVIYAVGYEPEELRGQLVKAEMNRTSVIVTEPQTDLSPWHGRYLIWETARPYFYTRLTKDGRVIAGGYDEVGTEPLAGRNARDKFSQKLAERVQQLFPSFQVGPAYEWNATFGISRDNLPFIGEDPKWPRVYYCLGYGGNGTVYSMMGAGLIRDLIKGYSNPVASIIGLDRPSLQQSDAPTPSS
ncbi:FAD-binding oxidoreductase [Paenibacillus rhizovicinus]|uniref:FAD-binding oxidoreductase n=1 Tax=Paenibacillus rhizovicinus TaxID=2704463 RepID=A0A6C0NXB5_9BACL|nr:FAD-dependent oxidoreductase [Paenibacillus rhizovicinus]QHW30839.1 FAD-binding oxidoreductase [Paenibacillus rhizovicinus]